MKALLLALGLVALLLATVRELEPRQPSVLIDVPIPADPADDLNLNGVTNG
jgi:hypothetical protein